MDNNLYTKHQKIYPREVHGLFAFWRTVGVFVLLGLYYLLPWITWEGRQAVLFDLPDRKFYIFDITFWPQDFFFLAVLLIAAALTLFFFTALAGRLWCGYACPQTVWTEMFLWMERKIEGDRPKQIKLDQMPWSLRKLTIKTTKHTVWILFSLYTGFSFIGYFTPIRELTGELINFNLGPWESFWIFFYSLATYGNAGWLREQVCIYMCPYARFQSAMFDRDTLIISYDPERGDPKGSRKRGVEPSSLGLGDCIDCTLCVQVCPTGIDIRHGLQYQCIGCAACIDVCDQVMDQMGYEKGLVRYTTENAMIGKPAKVLRPRTIVYATLLSALFIALIYAMIQRSPLGLDVIRDRNTLYRSTDEGQIENVYTLKIINMDTQKHSFRLQASGIDSLQLVTDKEVIEVDGNAVYSLVVRLRADPDKLSTRSSGVKFTVQSTDTTSLSVTEDARFLGPQL
ncbi:MAG: cytochrome c oxidase accessory protein CcoG [Gammaproteobacteria bacterium]|nr:cytochrome c oxidase accessory protein CcoG [Gammaproteobacteria bacterium]